MPSTRTCTPVSKWNLRWFIQSHHCHTEKIQQITNFISREVSTYRIGQGGGCFLLLALVVSSASMEKNWFCWVVVKRFIHWFDFYLLHRACRVSIECLCAWALRHELYWQSSRGKNFSSMHGNWKLTSTVFSCIWPAVSDERHCWRYEFF